MAAGNESKESVDAALSSGSAQHSSSASNAFRGDATRRDYKIEFALREKLNKKFNDILLGYSKMGQAEQERMMLDAAAQAI